MHLSNSFNQHNKVRRPGESHRGAGRKKKIVPGSGVTFDLFDFLEELVRLIMADPGR